MPANAPLLMNSRRPIDRDPYELFIAPDLFELESAVLPEGACAHCSRGNSDGDCQLPDGKLFVATCRSTKDPDTALFAGLSMLNCEVPLTGPGKRREHPR
jgi:hypothetical protein